MISSSRQGVLSEIKKQVHKYILLVRKRVKNHDSCVQFIVVGINSTQDGVGLCAGRSVQLQGMSLLGFGLCSV